MSIKELRTFVVSCDYCSRIEHITTHTAGNPPLPTFWQRDKELDCGMTGYTKDTIACGSCYANRHPAIPNISYSVEKLA